MNKTYALSAMFGWLLSVGIAGAQHIDIMVWKDIGKIAVGQYDYDNLEATETRVQIARFDDFYSVDSPGFTAFEGPDALPGNADLEWDFMPMTVDSGPHAGYESTLLYWDAVGTEPKFGPTPTDAYEFSLFGQSGPGVADGSSQITPGGVIRTTPPNGALHEHLYYYLDDNGDGLNTTLPDAGIYVAGMRLSMAGLEASEPFYLVWATPELEVIPAIRHAAFWVNQRVDTLFVDDLPGDYNADGVIDAADYTVWRDFFGQSGGVLAADGNGDRVVDALDYTVWHNNYGSTVAPSATSTSSSVSIPEPRSALLFTFFLIGAGRVTRRRIS